MSSDGPPQHMLMLKKNPLTIYIHRGGRDVVYFDLIADSAGRLSHIDLRVETHLPDRAFILAWEPLNTLLDHTARNYPIPLVISRLELLSPSTMETIAYNMVLPNNSGLRMGPLGGMLIEPLFVPSAAIWREAINSSSPFYRLLCAYRLEDAVGEIRRELQSRLKKRDDDIKLPPETRVDPNVLRGLAISEDKVQRMRTLRDLYNEFRALRNAIAHFLINMGPTNEQKTFAPISDGNLIRNYSVASSALLHHVDLKIKVLHEFVETHRLGSGQGSSILPLPQDKLKFPVRDPSIPRGPARHSLARFDIVLA